MKHDLVTMQGPKGKIIKVSPYLAKQKSTRQMGFEPVEVPEVKTAAPILPEVRTAPVTPQDEKTTEATGFEKVSAPKTPKKE